MLDGYPLLRPCPRVLGCRGSSEESSDSRLVDLGHLDWFWLWMALPADKGVGHDDHFWHIIPAHVHGDGIGEGAEMVLANGPSTELADALGWLPTNTTLHVDASWVSPNALEWPRRPG